MDNGDAKAFSEAWAGTWDQYGRNMTSAGLKMAFRALRDLDIGTVKAALQAHINAEPNNPPTVGAIRTRIGGDMGSRAHLAWAKLRDAIRRVGPYRSVAFDDQAIHNAVRDLGGWQAVNDWTVDELPFCQQRFERAYRAHAQMEGAAHPPYLTGIAEQNNSQEGFGYDKPALVGDPEMAAAVMASGQRMGGIVFQDAAGQLAAAIPSRLTHREAAGSEA